MAIPLPVIVATIISCVGNSFTILTYLIFPELRTPSQIFALWLAIGSYGYCFFTFVPMIYTTDNTCKYYGALSSYFGLVSAFTTAVIAYCMRNIFLSYNSQTHEYLVRVNRWHYFIVFVFPMCLVWLPAITNSFGKNEKDIFCWIRVDSDDEHKNEIGFIWIIVTFYIPLFGIIIYNSIVYVSVYRQVQTWKKNHTMEVDRVIKVVNKIRWYPIILVLCYIFPLYHRLAGVTPGIPDYRIYTIMGTTILKLQGFFDAVAYSATPMVLTKWRKKLHDVIGYQNLSDTVSSLFSWSRADANSSHASRCAAGAVKSPLASPDDSSANISSSKGSSYFSYAQNESSMNDTNEYIYE